MTFTQLYDNMSLYIAKRERQREELLAEMKREKARVDAIIGYQYACRDPGFDDVWHPKLTVDGRPRYYASERHVAIALDQLAAEDGGQQGCAEACRAAAQAD